MVQPPVKAKRLHISDSDSVDPLAWLCPASSEGSQSLRHPRKQTHREHERKRERIKSNQNGSIDRDGGRMEYTGKKEYFM